MNQPNHTNKRFFEALLRTDFTTFAMRAHREIRPASEILHNWHLDVIAHELGRCIAGACRRLIINVPPGCLKSKLVNVALPAFILGHLPSLQILSASHAMPLSTVHSVDTRLVMESPFYQRIFPQTKIIRGDNQKTYFRTTRHGSRRAVGMGSGATGMDANLLIVDDPHDVDDALNAELLRKANEVYETKLERRLRNPESDVIIVIMQRLHPDDLCGFLEKRDGLVEDGGKWRKVKIPMVAEDDEVYEVGKGRHCRAKGELLHPERMTPEDVGHIRKTNTEFMWWGQFQQEPRPLGGSLIKKDWLVRYTERPKGLQRIIHSWDCAGKDKVTSSYSVCLVFGVFENRLYLLHVWRERVNYPDLVDAFRSLVGAWKPTEILVEDESTGQALIPDMKRETPSAFIKAVEPTKDKLTRLYVQATNIAAGRLALPERAPWSREYEDELTGFPLTAHSDQVDATSQALNYLYPKEANRAVQRARAGAV